MVYGVTGFSGRAVAERLCEAGHDVVLAGRDAERVRAVADALGAPWRAFALHDLAEVASRLAGIDVVLHAAGPYADTAGPMLIGCIAAGAHYLDLSGEWQSFVLAESLGSDAAEAGVMLMPGVGLMVVATDCLLAKAVQQVPDAALVRIATSLPSAVSRGTLQTSLGVLTGRVVVRRDGVLRSVPTGGASRTFNFGAGERRSLAVSWPDLVTAPHTTGVANIETYLEAPEALRRAFLATAHAARLYGQQSVRTVLSPFTALWPERPSERALREDQIAVVVEAVDPWRRATRFGLRTLDGYSVTTLTAHAAVEHVLGGVHAPGFRTPASVFGTGFIEAVGCAWPFDAGLPTVQGRGGRAIPSRHRT
jgi:short subunit dehydrogenase-like uncharacterized protein